MITEKTRTPKLVPAQIDALIKRAIAAGLTAGAAAVPMPMIVRGFEDHPVMDGPCGFAWVNVKPANGQVARALVAAGLAHKDSYAGGVTVWISEWNQSMARKEAHARAFAGVLRDAGIAARADSRMD